MTRGRPPKAPIYVLAHGIEVIGEYAPNTKCPYWRVRIRPHRFFHGTPVVCNGIYVRRSRVMLAAKLGRALLPSEHAHHDDKDRSNDAPGNVELLTAAEHNRHHKTGATHRPESREKTSRTLKQKYAAGEMKKPGPITHRDHLGRITTCPA